ncbi:hypothetical protein J2X12_000679 [Pseudarthrobacter oxydans]|uniref:Uncharacterized protein n=1 Tax=Pseudarthrobacter oxydans TaxID=1671 RepID=A0AAW8N9L3_PSEOX|nr:hypothetical protein [Pseudarthrobacter oxydans]MDR6790894.1 hypothetical protein [Pseudarthrobacter oxydans]MDR7162678.1 hypothetical protein [Pseudarthrobacter oxydans]
MTARASVLPAALLRAGLLAAVMAIVAGIFGMHVMTADHSSHAAHAGAAVAAGDAAVGHAPAGHTAAEHAAVDHSAGHTAVEHSDAGPAAVLADAVGAAGVAFTASESCSAGCPDVREGGASCTPLAKTESLAAVPPPANPTALLAPASGAHETTGYCFVPPSKTPCELSISRT